MAAALVPIITSLAPVVIPALVQGVESLFPRGSGPGKMSAVVGALQAIWNDLAKAGVSTPPPSADSLTALVETVVQDLKGKGMLPAPAGTTPIASLVGMSLNVSGVLTVTK